MRKPAAKDGVGQLVLQIAFPPEEARNTAGETQDDGPQASSVSALQSSQRPPKRKWYSLYDKVYALANLQTAWHNVAANHGAAGIDGMTVARFAHDPTRRLQYLSQDLRAKTYRPKPVRQVLIPKQGGGQRPLGIPTVVDRIVQQALLQVMEPIFEAKFSKLSHGFRPERGTQTALSVVDRAVGYGYAWVVDADLQTFFDTMEHPLLLQALNQEIADGSVLHLITQILKAGIAHPNTSDVEPSELGAVQGGPLSPLLANVYLHPFDVAMAEAGLGLVRYADDFVIFAKSEAAATSALKLAQEVLEGQLKLKLHPEKTRVVSVEAGFEFLGFHYFGDAKSGHMVKEVRPKSAQRFRQAVRERTPKLKTQRRVKARHVSLPRLLKNPQVKQMIGGLNRLLLGWHAYFRGLWSRYPETPFRNEDGFIRRRVRSAIVGRVGSGWWNVRLNNQTLSALGLVSLDALQREYRSQVLVVAARKG